MTSYNSDGTVGPWAREKLTCLEKYLSAYTTILRKQTWCDRFFYFDAFAGAGTAPLRTTKPSPRTSVASDLLIDIADEARSDSDVIEYVKGSPHVAMGISNPFTEYYFVEQVSAKADTLRNDLELQYGSSHTFDVINNDVTSAIYEKLINGSFNWKRSRGVVFLDPFGLQVRWETIEALARIGSIEVIINLPMGTAIQRLLPVSGEFSRSEIDRLDSYFGSSDWYDVAYEKRDDMFGKTLVKYDDAGKRLAVWYRNRLKDAFGFASAARLIRNHKGGHLYYLIWAGKNSTGRKIAGDILEQGEAV